MADVVAFPVRGDFFSDARGEARALRVSWHPEDGVVVLSLWRADACVATFRLPASDTGRLVHTLVDGLVAAAPENPGQTA